MPGITLRIAENDVPIANAAEFNREAVVFLPTVATWVANKKAIWKEMTTDRTNAISRLMTDRFNAGISAIVNGAKSAPCTTALSQQFKYPRSYAGLLGGRLR